MLTSATDPRQRGIRTLGWAKSSASTAPFAPRKLLVASESVLTNAASQTRADILPVSAPTTGANPIVLISESEPASSLGIQSDEISVAPALPVAAERSNSGQIHAKVLLVQHGQSFRQARSLVFGGTDFHVLPITEETQVEHFLTRETVDVILADCRSAKECGLAVAEKLRQAQPAAKVVLVVDHLELRSVVKGIRLGLKDMHALPLNIEALLANLADFAAIPDQYRKAFCSAAASQLVDFLVPQSGTAAAVPVAAVESGVPAASRKAPARDRSAAPVTEQSKMAELRVQLAAENTAIQTRQEELERRDAALAKQADLARNELALARAAIAAQEAAARQQAEQARSLLLETSATSGHKSDEMARAARLLAEQQAEQARRAAELSQQQADLARAEASLNAARAAIEAEQATLQEREKAYLTARAELKRTEQQARFQAAAQSQAELARAKATLDEERQQITAERKSEEAQRLRLEQELQALRQDFAAERAARAAAESAAEARRAALAQDETKLKYELARVTAVEARAKEVEARLTTEKLRLEQLVAERTAAMQVRETALRQQEARLQAEAARAAALAAGQFRQAGQRIESEQAELAKVRAFYSLKLAALEKTEAEIEIKRQRAAKELLFPETATRAQKTSTVAAARDSSSRVQTTLPAGFGVFARNEAGADAPPLMLGAR